LNDLKLAISNAKIVKVTCFGVVINIFLSVIKITIGSFSGSMALVADGIHSLSDMVTDVVVLLGTYLGAKKPDSRHPYGHGRAETFSALAVAIILAVVGSFMIFKAAKCMYRLSLGLEEVSPIGIFVLYAALLSVVLKEMLYWITRRVAVTVHSPSLYANAWHHRTDAASSIAVVIGFIAFKMGYQYGDHVAAVVVGLMIVFVAAKIIRDCMDEFAERAVDSDTVSQIEGILASESRIRGWHKLRTRNVGREIFLDMHIFVDPQLSIIEAHGISEALEETMHEKITRPVNITVHVEPYQPHLEK
jgi:cation diffusion facilitator family transporter